MLAAASSSFGDLSPGWTVASELQLLLRSLAAVLCKEFTGAEPNPKLRIHLPEAGSHRNWSMWA